MADALSKNDTQKIERILKDNAGQMTAGEKRLIYGFALNYSRRDNTLSILEMLAKYNIQAVQYDLYHAIDASHRDNVIEYILAGGVNPNGEILLLAAEKQRLNFVRQFTGKGVDVNYRYPDGKSYADGMTALLWAVKWNDYETVRLLVECGANINVRAKNGDTALSMAFDNGSTDIYNYLKEKGAIETGPNTVNVPPAGQGIGNLMENGLSQFRPGTYRLSRGNTEMKFMGSGSGGIMSYRNTSGNTGNGYYQLNGNTMTMVIGSLTFIYRVDSNVSFSGNGETWVRTGD
ncbi:MAG: ankyrin repeat domain-containing protein [Treponema sp.]|nr:ankyrin repeat domain-containing protein [Treponema sp.]